MDHETRTLQEQITDLRARVEKLEKVAHEPRDLLADLVQAIKSNDKAVVDAIKSCQYRNM